MRPVLSDDEAAALAREVLDVDRVALEPITVGYGSVSWRVESDRGRFVLKVGPRESAAKWASGRVGMGLATRVGVPTQRTVHFSVRDDRVVRAFEWVDGTMARSLHDRPDAQARLGADLGRAIATLHAVPRVSYSSRLEGSAPTFARWDEYVHHRLAQIGARVRATASVDEATLARASALASTIAGEVTDSARMTLCHRDLHPDNLVVDEDGALLAILDWDMAEVWDQSGEWFKLDWMLFTALPACQSAFEAAYDAIHPDRPEWARRVLVVDVLESLNAVANAASEGWGSFGVAARERLDRLLDGR
jgi:aminoglycoside phosphotransferase (APT) family kinase protein